MKKIKTLTDQLRHILIYYYVILKTRLIVYQRGVEGRICSIKISFPYTQKYLGKAQ